MIINKVAPTGRAVRRQRSLGPSGVSKEEEGAEQFGAGVLYLEDPRPGEYLAFPFKTESQLRDSTGFAPVSSGRSKHLYLIQVRWGDYIEFSKKR